VNGPQIAEFTTAVSEAFNYFEFEQLLLRMDKRLTNFVAAALPFPDQVAMLVGAANSAGWIGQLISEVKKARPNSQSIRNFLANNPDWDPAASPPEEHPCDALFLLGGKSFVGRDTFRGYLKAMERDNESKVLVITSDRRRVGKTYSRELVQYLAMRRNLATPVYLDLDEDTYDPGTLAKRLGARLKIPGNVPDRAQQQAARWNQDLIEWLIPETPREKEPVWWIVLDGFSTRIPSEETQDFIQQLTQRVQSRVNFRLILVNYTYPLPLGVGGFFFKDKVDPVTPAELQAFLSRVHRQKRGAPPSAQELLDYVNGVHERHVRYQQQNPQQGEDQLLLNLAVVDVGRIIQT